MARLLLVYSTVDGHTLEIGERLVQELGARGHRVTLQELRPGSDPEPGEFDGVILGASIRYGKHRPAVTGYIERHLDALEARPSAFFSVNAVARKPEKRTPATNPYVRKFFETIDWEPDEVAIFGGKIEYPKYGWFDKTMIRFIMWMTKGPTDPDGIFDFTDWDDVDRFAGAIDELHRP